MDNTMLKLTFLVFCISGIGGVAVDVDHIVHYFGNPSKFWEPVSDTILGKLNEIVWGSYYSRPFHIPLAVIGILWFWYGIARVSRLIRTRILEVM